MKWWTRYLGPIYTGSQIQPESDIQMESDLFKYATWPFKPIGFQLDVAQIWFKLDLTASVNGAFDSKDTQWHAIPRPG